MNEQDITCLKLTRWCFNAKWLIISRLVYFLHGAETSLPAQWAGLFMAAGRQDIGAQDIGAQVVALLAVQDSRQVVRQYNSSSGCSITQRYSPHCSTLALLCSTISILLIVNESYIGGTMNVTD